MKTTLIKLLTAVALLLGLLTVNSPAADAQCTLMGVRSSHDPDLNLKSPTPRCDAGAGMALYAGPSIGIFRSGQATAGYLGPDYGSIKLVAGTIFGAVLLKSMHALVISQDVPWPRADSKTARKYRDTIYRVYQIYFRHKHTLEFDACKYGITRVGEKRPRSQIPTCERDPRAHTTQCFWRWVRYRVVGWERARQEEAGYAARYKFKRGYCPVGMPKCL